MSVPMLGEFPILRVLTTGGFGNVYLGWNPRLSAHVAVKVLCPAAARQSADGCEWFEREGHVRAGVTSQHVVANHDARVDAASGLRYVVTEYFGITAQAYLDEVKQAGRPGLKEEEALATSIAATNGLVALHAAGASHGDVKPANILLPVEGTKRPPQCERAKLASLGLAPPEKGGEAGQRAGTLLDIYGMGATLYALLCGRPPFTGDAGEAGRSGIPACEEALVPVYRLRSDVSGETAVVVERCLARKPEERFAGAEELAAALAICQAAAHDRLAEWAKTVRWDRKLPLVTLRLKLLDRWRYGMLVRPDIEAALREEFGWPLKPSALAVFAIDEVVSNAFEYGCKRAPDKEVTISLDMHTAGDALEVAVTDQGEGFDLEQELAEGQKQQVLPGRGIGLTVVKYLTSSLTTADGGRTVRAVLKRGDLEACQPISNIKWPVITRAPAQARGFPFTPSRAGVAPRPADKGTGHPVQQAAPPVIAEIRAKGLRLELFSFGENFGTARVATIRQYVVAYPARPGTPVAEELEQAITKTVDELLGKLPTVEQQEDRKTYGRLKVPTMQIAGFPDLGFALVRLSGLLEGDIVPMFRERLLALVRAGRTRLVLYMANVSSIRTEWIGAAVPVWEAVEKAGGALIMASPSPHAWQQARLAGFDQLVRKEDCLLHCVAEVTA
ncbi:MAG: ATP-binding protein [Planctomycetota bacterium]|nr:ATP-binding protein [Planctomycetota bacterium]